MTVNPIVMLMICTFLFIPLLLAEIARNYSAPTISDFFLQGRKLKLFPMYATVFATWMSAFAFMGGIAYFYEAGPIYMTTIGWDALFAVLFYAVGRRIWFYGKTYGYVTPADFFDDIYGSRLLSLSVTVVTIVFTMFYLLAQMMGGILLLQAVTRGYISWQVSGLIFFAVLVIYLWAGGLRAVALTDIFYGALIIITLLGCGFYLMKTAGGMETMFARVVDDGIDHVTLGGEDAGFNRTALWLSLFFVVPVGAFMGPQIWIRNFAAGSVRHFETLPFFLCLSSIVCVGTLFAGTASILLNKNNDGGDMLIASMMSRYAPPLLCAFVVIGIVAAILSTANSQIHALVAIYTIDIHKRYANRNITEKNLLSVAKWAVVVVSGVTYLLILLIPQSVFDIAVLSMGGTMQLIVPVLGALFWKRSTALAALAGLWSGVLTFFFLDGVTSMTSAPCAVLGLMVNVIFFVSISFFSRRSQSVGKKIAAYRATASRYLK